MVVHRPVKGHFLNLLFAKTVFLAMSVAAKGGIRGFKALFSTRLSSTVSHAFDSAGFV